MIETSITIGGFTIYEPTTVLTDLIITILCFHFLYKLKNNLPSVNKWKMFFLFFGLSTLVGAFSHALFKEHSGAGYKSFWLSMQVLNLLAVFSAQLATYHSVLLENKHNKVWLYSYYTQLILFTVAVFVFHNFLVVVLDNAIGLIPVLILHLKNRKQAEGYKGIANGILISFLTGIVHGTKLTFHAYFNFNDIAHVLIMISLYYIYSGVKKLTL